VRHHGGLTVCHDGCPGSAVMDMSPYEELALLATAKTAGKNKQVSYQHLTANSKDAQKAGE